MEREKIFRVYKHEVSSYVRKDGMRLVKTYGCNGKQHRISYVRLACDKKMTYVNGGDAVFRPDKILGECDHKSCSDMGAFVGSEFLPPFNK
jgi:hypothetical protein